MERFCPVAFEKEWVVFSDRAHPAIRSFPLRRKDQVIETPKTDHTEGRGVPQGQTGRVLFEI